MPLSVIFLRLWEKAFYERDKNLRGPRILNEDVPGCFSVPTAGLKYHDLGEYIMLSSCLIYPMVTPMKTARHVCPSCALAFTCSVVGAWSHPFGVFHASIAS